MSPSSTPSRPPQWETYFALTDLSPSHWLLQRLDLDGGACDVHRADSEHVLGLAETRAETGEHWLLQRLDPGEAAPHLDGHGDPIPVHELGAAHVDYAVGDSQRTHVAGEVVALSAADCDEDHLCFRLAHDGTGDKLRVRNDNPAASTSTTTATCAPRSSRRWGGTRRSPARRTSSTWSTTRG